VLTPATHPSAQLLFNPRSVSHPLHSSHAEKIFFLVSFRLARRAREIKAAKKREIYIAEAWGGNFIRYLRMPSPTLRFYFGGISKGKEIKNSWPAQCKGNVRRFEK